MSAPRWLGLAQAAYGLLLRLYPRALRERHGEEMRQAFRDRCREVGAGRISAWRLFLLELSPDFAMTVTDSRFSEPGSPGRLRRGLAALLLLAGLWGIHDVVSPRVLDGAFAMQLRWEHWQQERALAADEARLRALAARLAASADPRDRSLAAWLYAFVHKGRSLQATYVNGAGEHLGFAPLPADGERAVRALATLPATIDLETARTALAAGQVGARCDRMARARALVEVEPRNAYGWSELLKLQSQAGNEAAVRRSLHSLAQASFYDDGVARGRRALLAATERLAPGDAATTAAVGRALLAVRAMTTDDFAHDLRYLCALPANPAPSSVRWLLRNPGSRDDCRRAAGLLADSRDAMDSVWGWHMLERFAPSATTREGLATAREAARRQMRDIGSVPRGERGWRPWTDGEWQAWADAERGSLASR